MCVISVGQLVASHKGNVGVMTGEDAGKCSVTGGGCAKSIFNGLLCRAPEF